MWESLLRDAVTLFVVIDPIGLLPIHVSVTRFLSPTQRQGVAWRAVGVSAVILLLALVGGQFLLESLHVRLASFQVAGGIILFLLGLQMLAATEPKHEPEQTTQSADVAIYPLAIPFIAGPGSMLAVIVLSNKARFGILEQARTGVVLLVVLGVTLLTLLAADRIQRLIGATGANVVSRIMGLILCALAAESVLTGIETTFFQPSSK